MHQQIEISNQKIKYIWENESVTHVTLNHSDIAKIKQSLAENIFEGEFMGLDEDEDYRFRGFWQVAMPSIVRPEFDFALSENPPSGKIEYWDIGVDIMLPVDPKAKKVLPVKIPNSVWVKDFENTSYGYKQREMARRRILKDREKKLREFDKLCDEWLLKTPRKSELGAVQEYEQLLMEAINYYFYESGLTHDQWMQDHSQYSDRIDKRMIFLMRGKEQLQELDLLEKILVQNDL